MKNKHDRHLSSNKRDLEIAKKNHKRGDPEHFGLISGDLRVFFMFSWGRGLVGVGTIFGGDCTFSACHDKMQTNVF